MQLVLLQAALVVQRREVVVQVEQQRRIRMEIADLRLAEVVAAVNGPSSLQDLVELEVQARLKLPTYLHCREHPS